MKLERKKVWKIVRECFKKEYGYPVQEHACYDLVKFLVKCITKEYK